MENKDYIYEGKSEFDLLVTGSVKNYKVTTTLLVLIVSLHVLLFVGDFFRALDIYEIWAKYSFYKASILEGEFYRLFTASFIHLDFTHLIFNSLSLLIIGSYLEKRIGTFKMFVLTLIGIPLVSSVKMIWNVSTAAIGASGFICFLFAFVYVAFFKKMSTGEKKVLQANIILVFVMTFLIPNVSISGHLSGLLTGFVVGLVLKKISKFK